MYWDQIFFLAGASPRGKSIDMVHQTFWLFNYTWYNYIVIGPLELQLYLLAFNRFGSEVYEVYYCIYGIIHLGPKTGANPVSCINQNFCWK